MTTYKPGWLLVAADGPAIASGAFSCANSVASYGHESKKHPVSAPAFRGMVGSRRRITGFSRRSAERSSWFPALGSWSL
jgi:hypothetical protein